MKELRPGGVSWLESSALTKPKPTPLAPQPHEGYDVIAKQYVQVFGPQGSKKEWHNSGSIWSHCEARAMGMSI